LFGVASFAVWSHLANGSFFLGICLVLPTLAIVLTKSGGNRVPPSASRADGHAIAGHLAATATLAIVYWATWGVSPGAYDNLALMALIVHGAAVGLSLAAAWRAPPTQIIVLGACGAMVGVMTPPALYFVVTSESLSGFSLYIPPLGAVGAVFGSVVGLRTQMQLDVRAVNGGLAAGYLALVSCLVTTSLLTGSDPASLLRAGSGDHASPWLPTLGLTLLVPYLAWAIVPRALSGEPMGKLRAGDWLAPLQRPTGRVALGMGAIAIGGALASVGQLQTQAAPAWLPTLAAAAALALGFVAPRLHTVRALLTRRRIAFDPWQSSLVVFGLGILCLRPPLGAGARIDLHGALLAAVVAVALKARRGGLSLIACGTVPLMFNTSEGLLAAEAGVAATALCMYAIVVHPDARERLKALARLGLPSLVLTILCAGVWARFRTPEIQPEVGLIDLSFWTVCILGFCGMKRSRAYFVIASATGLALFANGITAGLNLTSVRIDFVTPLSAIVAFEVARWLQGVARGIRDSAEPPSPLSALAGLLPWIAALGERVLLDASSLPEPISGYWGPCTATHLLASSLVLSVFIWRVPLGQRWLTATVAYLCAALLCLLSETSRGLGPATLWQIGAALMTALAGPCLVAVIGDRFARWLAAQGTAWAPEMLGAGETRRPLASHDVILFAGLVFLAILFVPLTVRRFFDPLPMPQNLRVLVTVPIVYAIAIVAAIYPKAVWPFAARHPNGERPFAAYAVSGVIAATASFVVSLVFRFAFDKPASRSRLPGPRTTGNRPIRPGGCACASSRRCRWRSFSASCSGACCNCFSAFRRKWRHGRARRRHAWSAPPWRSAPSSAGWCRRCTARASSRRRHRRGRRLLYLETGTDESNVWPSDRPEWPERRRRSQLLAFGRKRPCWA
jgi:hypothetical protein